MTYGSTATKRMRVIGTSANFGQTNSIPMAAGRVFTQAEVDRRRNVVVLGHAPGTTLFPATDPIGKQVRMGRTLYTVVGVFGKRPNPLGGSGPDEFAIVPHTTWQKVYGADAPPDLRHRPPRHLDHRDPARGRDAGGGDARDRGDHAGPARAAARSGERLRHRHAGGAAPALGTDQRRHLPRPGRDLVDRADGRRHRGDGDHDHQRHRADPRDRRPQGPRRAAPGDPLAVPARGRVPDVARRASSASSSGPASAG